jgi:hypothetical protein
MKSRPEFTDRFVVEKPTQLPEGTEIELLPLDPGDWLDLDERAALHRALLASQEDIEGGRLVDAEEMIRELRNGRVLSAATRS